mmetsp:Transcript_13294/g.31547  ORF Transcript_13294/g.31547 Transcript_13294/m.31547 type:complete len:204 (-) Transcript_13294:58-669(-)
MRWASTMETTSHMAQASQKWSWTCSQGKSGRCAQTSSTTLGSPSILALTWANWREPLSMASGTTSTRSPCAMPAALSAPRAFGPTSHQWPRRCLWSLTSSCFATTLSQRVCWARKPSESLLSCWPTVCSEPQRRPSRLCGISTVSASTSRCPCPARWMPSRRLAELKQSILIARFRHSACFSFKGKSSFGQVRWAHLCFIPLQ